VKSKTKLPQRNPPSSRSSVSDDSGGSPPNPSTHRKSDRSNKESIDKGKMSTAAYQSYTMSASSHSPTSSGSTPTGFNYGEMSFGGDIDLSRLPSAATTPTEGYILPQSISSSLPSQNQVFSGVQYHSPAELNSNLLHLHLLENTGLSTATMDSTRPTSISLPSKPSPIQPFDNSIMSSPVTSSPMVFNPPLSMENATIGYSPLPSPTESSHPYQNSYLPMTSSFPQMTSTLNPATIMDPPAAQATNCTLPGNQVVVDQMTGRSMIVPSMVSQNQYSFMNGSNNKFPSADHSYFDTDHQAVLSMAVSPRSRNPTGLVYDSAANQVSVSNSMTTHYSISNQVSQ
jgi:hypothetical protein